MSGNTTYMLSDRDKEAEESRRLDVQHDLLMHVFSGQLLHQSIPPLQGQSAIADIGTGTGSWLIDVARTFDGVSDRKIRLVGFDISSAKFRKSDESRVEFVTHDLTTAFPPEYHGKFDVVHLRLLVYAIREDDVSGVVENVIRLLKPGGYLQWQDTDLVDIWASPPSSIISQAISEVNLERRERQLSLFMPSTIIKSILPLSLPTEIPLVTVSSGNKDILRLLTVQTLSTEKATPPELEDAGQDLIFDVLLILLRSRALRRQSLGMSSATTGVLKDQSHSTHNAEGTEEQDPVRIEEELKQLKVAGTHRLNTKFTWIVAQKIEFNL